MTNFDFDLFVIGGGSGGVRAARIASQHGAKVGLAEEFRYGGTCVIRGCVPKKLMVYASSFADAFEDSHGFGWNTGENTFDWGRLISNKDAEISRLENIYRSNLTKAGVNVFPTRAIVRDAHTIELADGQVFRTKHILIATGGSPVVPDIPGAEYGITSNEIFDLDRQPGRIAIVGGGYIACEFAGILNGLGTHVLQLYRGEQILRGFDDDIRNHVADAMRERGVSLELQRDVVRVEKDGDGLKITLDNGETHVVDHIMFATGRRASTDGLGVKETGVKLRENGSIVVDEWSQTSVPSIFAVGDVTGRAALTPVAIRDGHAFADTMFGNRGVRAYEGVIATAIFTQPEAGTVGMTEAEAREQGEVEIYRSTFRPMIATLGGGSEKMLMKMIVSKTDQKVLGVHIVGHGAAEMVQLIAIPMRMGATKADFDATMAVHPTAAEELVTMRVPVE
ncbi:glutathione-disulfide reductase [Amaricoccus tamworthensis]|uniref:glutathione-disulfide reductase n=1 Tax=Amaricoccus tamworthensis TaxID=57002 RepID=UPI003C7C98A0